jgi:hypothetical protein
MPGQALDAVVIGVRDAEAPETAQLLYISGRGPSAFACATRVGCAETKYEATSVGSEKERAAVTADS